MSRSILVLGGPTASGKNRLALEIAAEFPCEIVNADSRQIYNGLRIGTGQPTEEEFAAVPHHLFGFLDPSRTFSAADYERVAFPVVGEILLRNRLPVVVGGTGFYIKALLKGVWPASPRDDQFRSRLNALREKKGNSYLHRILQRVDPDSSRISDPNDVYRVTRSLEIFFRTGIRKSQFVHEPAGDRFAAMKFYLNPDRATLRENIRVRTEQMFEHGWIEEVTALMEKYPGFEQLPAGQSLGYREIIRLLRGETDLSKCKADIIAKTSRYAKRQLTWFRNQDQYVPLPPRDQLHYFLKSVLQ